MTRILGPLAVLACGPPGGASGIDSGIDDGTAGNQATLELPGIRGASVALVPPPRPMVVGLQLGEKTTCLAQSDSRFRCFGALATHGPDRGGSLEVTDASVCSRDGREERCHDRDGRMHVRRTPFVEVRRGGAGCGRDPEGQVWCWRNREPEHRARLTPIPLEHPATALTTTGMEACALTANADVRCFDPVRHVFGFGRGPKVAGQGVHVIAGTYLQTCWGDDRGVACHRYGRTWRVPHVRRPRLLAVGLKHGCAVTDRGLQCWGDDRHGQRSAPPRLDGSLITDLAAGDDHTCALLFGGGVRCWGLDDRHQVSGPCAAGLCD